MGIIRHSDKLGRIIIPKEIRDALHMKKESPVETSVNGQSIILEKHDMRIHQDYLDEVTALIKRRIDTTGIQE